MPARIREMQHTMYSRGLDRDGPLMDMGEDTGWHPRKLAEHCHGSHVAPPPPKTTESSLRKQVDTARVRERAPCAVRAFEMGKQPGPKGLGKKA